MITAVALALAAATVQLPEGAELDRAIVARDAELFHLFFEQCDPARLRAMVDPGFEMFHDKDGLVYRKTDPKDRRKVVVELTAKGRRTIDAATRTRFEEAAESQPPFTAEERAKLAEVLRRWLAQVAG